MRISDWSSDVCSSDLARVAGYRHVRENRTPRFPEEVIAALLAWSLRYVTVFADDILEARRELDRLEARRDRLVAADARLPDADRRQRPRTRLKASFGRRRREGRGAPIWCTPHHGNLRVHTDPAPLPPPERTRHTSQKTESERVDS